MALLIDAKTEGAPFSNAKNLVRVEYDFASDAGAIGALTALTADSPVMVRFLYAHVKTACTSGGSATLSLGKAGTEFMSTVAVASLTLESIHVSATPFVELTDTEVIKQAIGTATFLTGKVEFVFEVMKK